MSAKNTKALEHYEHALLLNNKIAQIYANRAIIYFQQRKYKLSYLEVKKAQKMGISVNQNLLKALKEKIN